MIRRLAALLALSGAAHAQTYTLPQFMSAIQSVETGGQPNGGEDSRGDGGRALGPLQIHRAYHADASKIDKGLRDYRRCGKLRYSQRVVRAYMYRYQRAALLRLEQRRGTLHDCELLARSHNGGPRANRKDRRRWTDGYWAKVRKALR